MYRGLGYAIAQVILILGVLSFLVSIIRRIGGKNRKEEQTRHSQPVLSNDQNATKKCPACAESIRLEAKKCKFCGHLFDSDEVHQQILRAKEEEKAKTGLRKCPSCGNWDVHQAYVEDGGMGWWCPHCKKSVKDIPSKATPPMSTKEHPSPPHMANTKRCPDCAEPIRLEAKKCRFCGHQFDSDEVDRHLQLIKEEEQEKARADLNKCPSCGNWDVYYAYVEDGGMGFWCPHCMKSMEESYLGNRQISAPQHLPTQSTSTSISAILSSAFVGAILGGLIGLVPAAIIASLGGPAVLVLFGAPIAGIVIMVRLVTKKTQAPTPQQPQQSPERPNGTQETQAPSEQTVNDTAAPSTSGLAEKAYGSRHPERITDTKTLYKTTRGSLEEELITAAETGAMHDVTRLLAEGAGANSEKGSKHSSALIFAAKKGHMEVVRLLISAGADVNRSNADGITPMIIAAMNGHVSVMQLLDKNGADLNRKTVKEGFTALMSAVVTKQTQALRALVDMGADVGIRNKQGDTVLQMAEAHQDSTAVGVLSPRPASRLDSPRDRKIESIKSLAPRLYRGGYEFANAFDSLFSALSDSDPEVRAIASALLAACPHSEEQLISIYRTAITNNPYRAVLACRVLGRKLSHGNPPEMIAEDLTESMYGLRVAFTAYCCKHCGGWNAGIPVPTRYLSFYGQKDGTPDARSLPVLCDSCGKSFFLCWD